MTFSSPVCILSFNTSIKNSENRPVHLQEAIAFYFHYKAFKDVWVLSYLDKMEEEVQ